jgi:hypothetical protein
VGTQKPAQSGLQFSKTLKSLSNKKHRLPVCRVELDSLLKKLNGTSESSPSKESWILVGLAVEYHQSIQQTTGAIIQLVVSL